MRSLFVFAAFAWLVLESPIFTQTEAANKPKLDVHGDSLPDEAIARLGTMRLRHGNGASLAFAPDGKSLLTAGGDRTIRTWDLASGRLLHEQRLPPGEFLTVAVLSPDGRLLAFKDYFGPLVLWDVACHQLRHQFAIEGSCNHVVYSPDGKTLATFDESGWVRAWDVRTGLDRRLIRQKPNAAFIQSCSLSFAADGTLASLGTDDTLRSWDVTTGRERSHVRLAGSCHAVAFSPDGRVVAGDDSWRSDAEAGVRFWNAANGELMKDWQMAKVKKVLAMHFSPDGKTFCIGTEDGILVWDPIAGKTILRLSGRCAFDFSFSPDGKTIASLGGERKGSNPYCEQMVRVWDWSTGQPHAANSPEWGHSGFVDGVVFAPDGRTLASSSSVDHSLRFWDVAGGRLLRSLAVKDNMSPHALTFSPDGKYMFVGTKDAIVRYEAATGRETRRYLLVEKGKAPHELQVMHLSEDGGTLLAVSRLAFHMEMYALHAWNAMTGEHLRFVPFASRDGWVRYGRFSPDGRLLALPEGSILDTTTGAELRRLSRDGEAPRLPIAYSADGALIAAELSQQIKGKNVPRKEPFTIQVWETESGLPMASLKTESVFYVAFTRDSRHLITAGYDSLKLWDLVSGRVVARRPAPGRFQGEGGAFASSLALAPDGRTVATGQPDTTIVLWDLPTPRGKPAPLTPAAIQAYWADLAGMDGERIFTAIARLTDAPPQSVELLRTRLRPVSAPADTELRQLLADLDADSFERRQAAAKRLRELGELARNALQDTLRRKPSLEVRRRIEDLLVEPKPALTPEARRQLRAIHLLETIGTAEARRVLETLASGATEAQLTREAKASLTRLKRRTHP